MAYSNTIAPKHASARPETGSPPDEPDHDRDGEHERRQPAEQRPDADRRPDRRPDPVETKPGTLRKASIVNGSRAVATPVRPKARYQAR